MTAKPWTTTEEAHLRKWAGIALVTQIAADLNRTNASIYKRMQALKLKGVKQGEKHSQAKTTRVVLAQDAKAIIDGLRGEVAAQRVKTCIALKERNDAREERDRQAQRIGELEALLREAHDTYRAAIHWEDLRGTMKRIDAALSAGKEGE